MHSYNKEGFREGIVFAFYKDGKLLIEHRPPENGGTEKETFIPNGSIETKDHIDRQDYRLVALEREINEEFFKSVTVSKAHHVGDVSVEAINVHFYVYLILDWKGKLPTYTMEEGEKYADLEWIDINKSKQYFKYDSAVQMSNMIKKYAESRKESKLATGNSIVNLPNLIKAKSVNKTVSSSASRLIKCGVFGAGLVAAGALLYQSMTSESSIKITPNQ